MMNPTRYRESLPRLNIPSPLTAQQPLAFDSRPSMFSPALPTTLQNSFHPPFPGHNIPMQTTPMQPFFASQPVLMTHRPQPSLVHLGIQPQPGIPMIPPTQIHVRHPSGAPGFGQHIPPPRSRRQPSIGGPPKAVLGGPGRKVSPLPAALTTSSAAANVKAKKITVNLPKETVPGDEDGAQATHPPWARTPLDPSLAPDGRDVVSPESATAELYPPESWARFIPLTIMVFLPPKSAWNAIKQQLIEEKLEKLGVERGSGAGSTVPHIYAPHARAASISSPADPALLLFKLNKLQQTQTVSSISSGATSPQPPFALSPSPHHPPPRFQRHGHSVSLVQPLTLQPPTGLPAALNPFGPNATLGSDQIMQHVSPGRNPAEDLYAARSHPPLASSPFAPPLSAITENRPNFTLGFGLDIPEEEEPQEPISLPVAEHAAADSNSVDTNNSEDDEFDDGELDGRDGSTTAPNSRYHSRHVSRLSGALSLRSVGGLTEDFKDDGDNVPLRSPIPVLDIDDLDRDAVEEWTGSEDLYMGSIEPSEDESTGEWSNPSDEERVRRARVERRLSRRAQEAEVPRRIPKFPHPPQNTMARPLSRADDVVSNPSEEERAFGPNMRHPERSPTSQRPLPPLPHSRVASGQLSTHDPAHAHSRTASNQLDMFQEQALMAVRRNSLNPFAKPFVFGSALEPSPTLSTHFGHGRMASFGKPLNAGAEEFKPTGFTFLPPPGVPKMTLPLVEAVRPLPVPPQSTPPARAQQGREKRQRRDSGTSDFESDAEGVMNSFRFPGLPTIERKSRSEPTSPRTDDGVLQQGSLISSSDEILPARLGAEERSPLPYSIMADAGSPDETLRDESTGTADKAAASTTDVILPSAVKVKRAPVPLDFKQSSSNNTIPASAFKALAGDEKTRRAVRSRLGSREIYEHMHLPSLDDLTMPPISSKITRIRDITSPRDLEPPKEVNDVFGSHVKHRPSLPAQVNTAGSSQSGISIPAVDLTGRFEQQRLEQKWEDLLDQKLGTLHRELSDLVQNLSQKLSPMTESMISEVASLFRAQLQESALRNLDDSQLDARGELDFELIKTLVQQGQAEMQETLRSELRDVVERLDRQSDRPDLDEAGTRELIKRVSARTIDDFGVTIDRLCDRILALEPKLERGQLANDVVSTLSPILASLRSEPVDYEYLTAQLAQAVKPHISQLIDLASDKRETASLIVDRILPLLPAFDADAICGLIIPEIHRLIAPIDPFEIKEQVADLVVERLDSRLALRDRTFNAETVSAKVNEGMGRLVEPVERVNTTLQTLLESQKDVAVNLAVQTDAVKTIADLPSQLVAATEALQIAEAQIRSRVDNLAESSAPDETLSHMKTTVDNLTESQNSLSQQQKELLGAQQEVLNRLDALPESLATTTSILKESSAAFMSSHEALKRETDDLRKLNGEYQAQLSKARSAHGQARVERDMLSESLSEAEKERDALRAQVKELQVAATNHALATATLRAKIFEQEEALKRGLERLKADDVAAQVNQERIGELERSNRELVAEKQSLVSKVEALEYQVNFAKHDKEVAERSRVALQQQYDHLSTQEAHWDTLKHTSDKLDLLSSLLGAGTGNNEELKSLRQIRDRCHVLESEHVALQRRFKDQEAKAANSERVAAAALQSLTGAQNRASEWETRAHEYEGRLELTQTKLEQAEQMHTQLDADYSLASLQLEEQTAENRLAKERENGLRERISALERRVACLQDDVEQARRTPPVVVPNGLTSNGVGGGGYGLGSSASSFTGTPVQTNGRTIKRESPAYKPSVRDSMHAPIARASTGRYPEQVPGTPKPRVLSSIQRMSAPSPTPSTVSLTPTQDDEGWWHATPN